MAKTKIEISYSGKDYTLEYTAETIKRLEQTGKVSFGRIEDHLLTASEEIFYGAFDANHKDVSRKIRREIWKEIAPKDESGEEDITEVLFEMVNEAIESLAPKGNTGWKKTN